MTKGRMRLFSDGGIRRLITHHVLEMKSPQGPVLRLAATPSCFLQLCPEFRLTSGSTGTTIITSSGSEACYGGILWANLHLCFGSR